MQKIGFIGLGAMGGHMVRHLLEAGYEVHVADLNEEAVATAVLHGAVRCESAVQVADRAGVTSRTNFGV